MDLVLVRTDYRSDGVFGKLTTESNAEVARTLERAYESEAGFLPKVPPGKYTCRRGLHRLSRELETFEILSVPHHTGILFHVGNYNRDSEGCVLLGSQTVNTPGGRMLINSGLTFTAFMKLQSGCNEFQLVVC